MKKISRPTMATRRQFVMGASAVAAGALLPGLPWAAPQTGPTPAPAELTGSDIRLRIGYQPVNFTGVERLATTVNGSLPAPVIRLREGQTVRLHVTNELEQDSSIHWHGIILPFQMDGVPGLSFDGIKPGETFTYEFDVSQSGTYWYHSHSGYQEQTGLYGAMIIDPADGEPITYDREHTLVLSDWTDEDPRRIYAKLKKQSHYYNYNERTLGDWWRDLRKQGAAATWRDRRMWNHMRMSETDIADVTGETYTYLMNGVAPDPGWSGLFKKGERVRLRIINASAMSIFDFRIPGLQMSVVAADGQRVQPVTVDEFRIGTAETYDVVVEPDGGAYTLFAQSIDRTGFARGTLTVDPAQQAEIPAMDPAFILMHEDMGMDHGGHGHEPHEQGDASAPSRDSSHGNGHDHHGHGGHVDREQHNAHHENASDASRPGHHNPQPASEPEPVVDHDHHDHHQPMPPPDQSPAPMMHGNHQGMQAVRVHTENLGLAGFGTRAPVEHPPTEFGPHVDMRADAPRDGLRDPGVGLRDHQERHGRRVLTYGDLRNLDRTHDRRQPSRELHIHLTGNMARYMWSMNGIKFADAAPIEFEYGERLRIVLVNDTMMTHPIHLHGMWSELETGDPDHLPRKHTVLVQPGSRISYLVTADAPGRWAYHCHLLFHMPGMMREVLVRRQGGEGIG